MAHQPRQRRRLAETDARPHPPEERGFPLLGALACLLAVLDIASAIGMLIGQG
jgi:hypothetical protein